MANEKINISPERFAVRWLNRMPTILLSEMKDLSSDGVTATLL